MKLAISDGVERTTTDARTVIRSSGEAGLWLVPKRGMQIALMNSLCGTKRASSESSSE